MAVLTDKIKLKPTTPQEKYLLELTGTARLVYNRMLHDLKSSSDFKSRRPQVICKAFNSFKYTDYPWVRKYSKWVPQVACYDLGDAFENFHKKLGKFPTFKSKRDTTRSCGFGASAVEITGTKLKLPGARWEDDKGLTTLKLSRNIQYPGKIVGIVRIKRDACGDWWVTVPVELSPDFKYRHGCENQTSTVGIDLGLSTTFTYSYNDNHHSKDSVRNWTQEFERKIRQLSKSVARKKKGSRNRDKAKVKLAKVHRYVARCRSQALHEITAHLVKSYGVIGIEDLCLQGMLAKWGYKVSNAAFGEFRRQLEYKAVLAGSKLVIADRWFPSTKTCSDCGVVGDKLDLSVREWPCSSCGSYHDRDVNAARNLRLVAERYSETVNVCGGVVRLSDRRKAVKKAAPWKQKSKSEANHNQVVGG